MRLPNILIIHCHDLGDYLGCYGTPIPTPNIDQLASEGILLLNHFSTGTVCSPSRASMWTGCYPHTHGLMGLVPRGWEMDVEKCPPLMAILREQGYETALFGLQHEHWDPYRLGFEQVYGDPPYYCDVIAPEFIKWLENRQPGAHPFLASIGFFDPHRIGLASQGYSASLLGKAPSHFKRQVYHSHDPQEVEVRPYLPDIPAQREELADFYGAVKLVDQMVGDILISLEKNDYTKDTLVIFTTDHGASFLHSKATLYDGGTKVACMMRWPGSLPAGKIVETLTSHVDLVPTILDWLGIVKPAHIEGESFANILDEGNVTGREYVFAERNYTQYFDPSRMVRSQQYKYIRNRLRKCIFDFVLTEIEMSAASFRNNNDVFRFYSSKRVFEELYDLDKDPFEMNNLAADPKYKSTLEKLRAVLDAHLDATDDPFLRLHNQLLMPEDVYVDVKGIREKK